MMRNYYWIKIKKGSVITSLSFYLILFGINFFKLIEFSNLFEFFCKDAFIYFSPTFLNSSLVMVKNNAIIVVSSVFML